MWMIPFINLIPGFTAATACLLLFWVAKKKMELNEAMMLSGALFLCIMHETIRSIVSSVTFLLLH